MQLSKSLMEKDTPVHQRSQRDTSAVIDQSNVISEEDEMQKAIAMSLEGKILYFDLSFRIHLCL